MGKQQDVKKSGGKRQGAGRPPKNRETITVGVTFDVAQWAAITAAFGKRGRHKFIHNCIDKALNEQI